MKLFSILLLPLVAYAMPGPEAKPGVSAEGKPTAAGQAAIDAKKAIAASEAAGMNLPVAPLNSSKKRAVTVTADTNITPKPRSLEARDLTCEVIVPVGDYLSCYSGPGTEYTIYYYLSDYSYWDIYCYEDGQYIYSNPYWLYVLDLGCFIPDYWTNCNDPYVLPYC